MNYIMVSIVLLFVSLHSFAEEYRIRSAEELNQINLKPGDRVILEGKEWRDQKLVFKGSGTEMSPILLTTEKAGKVIMNGSSSLQIDGTWLIVDGLFFQDGYTLKENVISFSEKSENCRLTNSAIVDYDNPDKSMRNSWIVLYGFRNRVDHCYIKGKTHLGTTIGIYVSDQPNYHRIDHNYFAGRPPLGRNGGEIIRMGTDQWSMYDSFSIVEKNIFAHCDGEIEIISNKSTNNTISENLFYESKGMLTLRHGNKAKVYGNYFIGNRKEGTGGIRIIGEDHRICNNYFHGLTGTGLNATITLMNAWENPPLHGYWQVKNTEIIENVMIDCTQPIVVGSGKNEKTFLPPLNSVFVDNVILSSRGPVITWLETAAKNPKSIRFENNTAFISDQTSDEQYPPGVENIKPLLNRNNFGVFEQQKETYIEREVKSRDDVQDTLFRIIDIGPSWKSLNINFKTAPVIQSRKNIRFGHKPSLPYSADTSSDRVLDLYLPYRNKNEKIPVIIFVHGGGFSGGDKSSPVNFFHAMAERGYAVLSVNYRLYLKHHKITGASARANMSRGLPPGGRFHPGMQKAIQTATEDLFQVLKWVKLEQDKYHFDLERVSLAGGSAGAMAILNLAYASGQDVLPIWATINLWGGLQDATIIQKKAPPLLTFHGDKDDVIHVDYAYALDQRMKDLGLISEQHILKGKGHAQYTLIHQEYMNTIAKFLENPEAMK